MRNNPRQNEKNDLIVAGRIAQQRLAMGVRLNIPESTALLSAQIILLARTGGYSVARLMAEGRTMLGKRQVRCHAELACILHSRQSYYWQLFSQSHQFALV